MTPATAETDLLIIGAGPFGIAAAAYARHLGIDHIVVGEPMGFWKTHMPRGMVLRSACDWHLDPTDVDTIVAYLGTLGITPHDVEPLSLDFYLGYCGWFMRRKSIESRHQVVARLDRTDTDMEGARFEARMNDGSVLRARNVLLAVGMANFTNIPLETAALLPVGRYGHTCDVIDFARFRGLRVLIVGGRQSAFEWAALIAEADAQTVDVVYRHDTPRFVESDWTWVPPLVDRICASPSWFRSLTDDQRAAMGSRLWGEGRLKLEPWLARRIARESVRLWPRTTIAGCDRADDESMVITLDNGQALLADFVVFATGYRVHMPRVPFLAAGNVLPEVATRDGYPTLDEYFQTSVPGLYVTSMAAAGDYGPFMGFTVSARQSARAIGDHIASALTE